MLCARYTNKYAQMSKICTDCLRTKKIARGRTICEDCQVLEYIADRKEAKKIYTSNLDKSAKEE